MSYIDPESVVSPRNKIEGVEVLYNGGDKGWSVARLEYDGEERIGVRWNGINGEPGVGNPQSRAKPTWFILPKPLEHAVLEEIEKLGDSRHAELLNGYREMSSDPQREAEAREWSEALIGDGIDPKG